VTSYLPCDVDSDSEYFRESESTMINFHLQPLGDHPGQEVVTSDVNMEEWLA